MNSLQITTDLNFTQLEKIIREEVWKGHNLHKYPSKPKSEDLKSVPSPEIQRFIVIIRLISSLVSKIGNNSKRLRCLDIGTGPGGLILSLVRAFPQFEWYGLEHPDKEYLKKESYWNLLEHSNCSLTLCDIAREKLPFRESFFNLIILSEVIEHLPIESVIFVLNEIWRVLDEGGFLLISTPNQTDLMSRMRLLRGKSIFSLPFLDEGTFGHIRTYTVEELVTLTSFAGFKIQQIFCKDMGTYTYFKLDKFWKKIGCKILLMIKVISRLFSDRFGDTCYAVCCKDRGLVNLEENRKI